VIEHLRSVARENAGSVRVLRLPLGVFATVSGLFTRSVSTELHATLLAHAIAGNCQGLMPTTARARVAILPLQA
jgi:hypothetical protein